MQSLRPGPSFPRRGPYPFGVLWDKPPSSQRLCCPHPMKCGVPEQGLESSPISQSPGLRAEGAVRICLSGYSSSVWV